MQLAKGANSPRHALLPSWLLVAGVVARFSSWQEVGSKLRNDVAS